MYQFLSVRQFPINRILKGSRWAPNSETAQRWAPNIIFHSHRLSCLAAIAKCQQGNETPFVGGNGAEKVISETDRRSISIVIRVGTRDALVYKRLGTALISYESKK